MSYEQNDVMKLIGYTASVDLSSYQYRLVKIVPGTRTIALVAALTDRPIGILVNKPKAGEATEIVIVGVTTVVAGETLAEGDKISTSAAGKAMNDAPQAGQTSIGTVLTAGAVDELVTAAISCVF